MLPPQRLEPAAVYIAMWQLGPLHRLPSSIVLGRPATAEFVSSHHVMRLPQGESPLSPERTELD
jgi:hypothetical protein